MTVRTVSIDLPEEPGRGSVVIDRYGLAWQRLMAAAMPLARNGATWFRPQPASLEILPAPTWLPWPMLLATRGPVEVVFEPDVESPAAAETASPQEPGAA